MKAIPALAATIAAAAAALVSASDVNERYRWSVPRWLLLALLIPALFASLADDLAARSSAPTKADAYSEKRISGLVPDNWGHTLAYGTKRFRDQYAGVIRASCEGAVMIGQPRSESTWRADGKRWWDKFYCSGVAGRRSQRFNLIYDPQKLGFKTYRLRNITLSQLKQRLKPPTETTQPLAEPTPTTPTPTPTDATTRMLDEGYKYAIRRGEGLYGLRDSSGFYYHWLVRRNECVALSSDTGRCYTYVWKETVQKDSNFNTYISKYIFRLAVFVYDLGRGNYSSQGLQTDLEQPYQIVCSDIGAQSATRCSP